MKEFRIAFVGETGVTTVGSADVGACTVSEHDGRDVTADAALAYIDENCARDDEFYIERWQKARNAVEQFRNSDDDCCIARVDYGALVIVS